MEFYLFNIRPKLTKIRRHHWASHCRLTWRCFSTSPTACWCSSSSNLY